MKVVKACKVYVGHELLDVVTYGYNLDREFLKPIKETDRIDASLAVSSLLKYSLK